MGLRKDGTIRRSVADRRLRGGLLSIGPPIWVTSKLGASIRKKRSHPRGVFGPFRSRNFGCRSEFLALVELSPCADIRLAIKPWVSKMAQIESRQPDNAVASASISSSLRLLHSRYSPSIRSHPFSRLRSRSGSPELQASLPDRQTIGACRSGSR